MFDQWKLNHPWDNKIEINIRKNHKNGLGVTPAFLAAKNGSLEIFKMLHEHGAEIENFKCGVGGNQDLECIHIAAKEGNWSIVQYILSKSTNMVNMSKLPISHTGSTPLHLAAYGGHFSVAESLLSAGAPLL